MELNRAVRFRLMVWPVQGELHVTRPKLISWNVRDILWSATYIKTEPILLRLGNIMLTRQKWAGYLQKTVLPLHLTEKEMPK